ncbi:hypothetical protein Bca52824_064987 [Brassica carinata]|uniref:Uncharacterized protein n=1 Tax=Brassica carinata TaxID=52824 RepID=A0A8X7QJH6_BRACI|nr:hypothetical protein Bca52824_064987 [Brassica carinata]
MKTDCTRCSSMLEQPSLPEWKRLPLALIALVDGLLVIVTYSIPDEGGDPKWKKEVIDPQIDNLVRRMRKGTKFKATDFRGGDSSLPPLKPAKRLKEQELKEWIRVELKTQLGKLRNEIFDWLHHDRGGSFTVPQNTAAGKTNRDNSHADPTGMEGLKKRRPFSGDGNDEAEIFWSDSKKHKKNNGDGFSDDETMRMHDNHCDGRTPNARFWEKVDSMAGEGPSFSKSANIPEVDVSTPIGPEIVSKPAKPTLPEPLEGTRSYNVYKDPQRTLVGCLPFGLILNLTPLPEEQGGKAATDKLKITRHRRG